MNLEIVAPILIGILTFIVCAVANRYLPVRRPSAEPRSAALVPAARSEAILSIKASLQDLYRQIDSSPNVDSGVDKRSTIILLYRCGVPCSEIARHLRMSRSEVDLMIQVDRGRSERAIQQLSYS